LLVRGTGEQSRDFIHVMDTARAILACCNSLPNQQTLDIGIGETHKLLDLARIFNTKIVYEPELQGYAQATTANITHTQEFITWWPRIILSDWIRSQLVK
jgi:nucleoside-diphosphate-sugar epimerase